VNGHSVDFSHDGGGLQDHALNHLSALARVPCPPQLECSLHFFIDVSGSYFVLPVG
jgi:hypothetical protein